jgi:hypothetical protein
VPFIAPKDEVLGIINALVLEVIVSIKKDGCYDISKEKIINGLIKEVYGF